MIPSAGDSGTLFPVAQAGLRLGIEPRMTVNSSPSSLGIAGLHHYAQVYLALETDPQGLTHAQ